MTPLFFWKQKNRLITEFLDKSYLNIFYLRNNFVFLSKLNLRRKSFVTLKDSLIVIDDIILLLHFEKVIQE